jgi:autotransporter-associated beta strand protein
MKPNSTSDIRCPNRRTAPLMMFIAAALTLFTFPVYSQTTYVWTNLVSGDASGIWSTPANWSPNGTPVSGDTADFSTLDITAPSTVTLDANQTNAHLIFGDVVGSSDWTVSAGGGILTLSSTTGSPIIEVTNRSVTIQAEIDGTSGFTKLGAGTLILSGQNLYSGVTTQSVGTLTIATAAVGSPDAPLSGPFGVSTLSLEGGTLNTASGGGVIYNSIVVPTGKTVAMGTFVSGVQLALAGSISGGGTINESGNQTAGTHLSGTNSSFTGMFNSTGNGSHRVRFDNANSGSAAAKWFLDNSNTDGEGLAFGDGVIFFGELSGNAQIRNDNGGSGVGATVVRVGDLNTSSLFTGNFANVATLSLLKVGTGTLILSGANQYRGSTTISNGVLQLGNGGGSGTINNDGFVSATVDTTIYNYSRLVFNYNRSDTFTFNPQHHTGTGSLSFTNIGTGTMNLRGTNDYQGDTTIAAGNVRLLTSFAIPSGPGVGNLILNGSLDLNSNNIVVNGLSGNGIVDNVSTNAIASLTIGSNDFASTFNGIIRNTGSALSVNKVGAGKITLGGANTYRGATTVSNGELDLTTSQTGGGAISINTGPTLGVLVNSASSLPTATLTASSGSALNFSGVSSTTIAPINATNLAPAGTVTINVSGSFGAGLQYPLIKFTSYTGAGGFVLGSVPTGVTANLVTNGSTIALNVSAALPLIWKGNISANWDISTTANWTLNSLASTYNDGQSVQFNDTATTGNVNLSANVAPGGVLVSNNSLGYVLTSASGKGIVGSGSLTKQGSGTLTLTGLSNSYSGFSTISGGTVVIGADNNLGAAGTVVINGGALSAASSLTLNANRTLAIGPASGSGTGTIDVASGQTLAFSGVVANNLSGVGSLTKTGTGILTLNGANTYSGSTLVSAGTLAITAAQQTGGAITVNNGARLNVSRTGGNTLPTSALTLGSGGATTVGVGSLSSSLTNAVITATNLTTSGTVTVSILTGVPALGETPLIKYNGSIGGSGFGAFTLATLPPGVTGVLTNDTVNKIVGLNVSSVSALTWTGTNGPAWDVDVTTNWQFLGIDVTFKAGNAVIFDDSSFTNLVSLNASEEVFNLLVTNDLQAYTFTGNGLLTGPMKLTKAGTNVLTLANFGVNAYTGGALVQQGTLDVRNNTALGSGVLTLAGGTIVNNSAVGITLNNNIVAQASTSSRIETSGTTDSQITLNGNLSGSGNIVAADTGSGLGGIVLGGDNSGFTGTLSVSNNASMRFWFNTPSSGSANAQWVLDSTGTDNQKFTFGTGTISFGALSGAGNLRNDGGTSIVTLRIGDLNLNSTFSGQIAANGVAQFSVLKVGAATLTFEASEAYTSATIISNGVLALANNPVTLVDGAIPNTVDIYIASGTALDVSGRSDGNISLGASQTLRGYGTVRGSLDSYGAGTIAPGDGLSGNLGVLTVTNTLGLGGTAWMKLNRAASPNSDRLVAASINYGGTLVVTNAGAPLHVGDTFTLFSAPLLGGAFTLSLPSAYAWNTDNLAVNGSITVVGVYKPVITSANFSTLSSGFITLNGTNGIPSGSFTVLTSTNVALPLSNWTSVLTGAFDGSGNFSGSVPVDPSLPRQFFLLQMP